MKSIKNFNFQNKKVLVRCDFNVSVRKNGDILDDFKIQQVLPTINYLLKNKAKVIMMSHLGDPGGKIINQLSLSKVAERIEKLSKRKVLLLKNYEEREIEATPSDYLVLLENLRFYPEEEKGDIHFAKKLSRLADIYINDAFAVCHRNHA